MSEQRAPESTSASTPVPNISGPLSPLDGRYASATAPLQPYLCEAALNRYRIHVEVEWLIFLCERAVIPGVGALPDSAVAYLRALPEKFDDAAARELAIIEAETRHDVKAVEYFIKKRMDAGGLGHLREMVHIFCTSEDINSLAWALGVRDAVRRCWSPRAWGLVSDLSALARTHAELPMLAHTHGQPASPTTVGKELAVFAHRLHRSLRRVEAAEYYGKFSGATGTFSAHATAIPEANWPDLARDFVESLGLTWNPLTTQIESYDALADLFDDIAHVNRIAHNLATDMWTYISLDYFHQNLAAQGSTGSSTMPHKVNPIRFENAEANLEISSGLFGVLSQTLVTSRMQRDLTDSSTKRNIGVALGHSYLALDNLRRGLAGVDPHPAKLAADLDANWEVLGEPIQQAMRAAALGGAEHLEDPYERLKALTRGQKVTAADMREFIAGLGLPGDIEERLLALTPAGYTGLAARLVDFLEDTPGTAAS